MVEIVVVAIIVSKSSWNIKSSSSSSRSSSSSSSSSIVVAIVVIVVISICSGYFDIRSISIKYVLTTLLQITAPWFSWLVLTLHHPSIYISIHLSIHPSINTNTTATLFLASSRSFASIQTFSLRLSNQFIQSPSYQFNNGSIHALYYQSSPASINPCIYYLIDYRKMLLRFWNMNSRKMFC